MNWLNSYKASWKVVRIDPGTWEDTAVLSGARAAHVERDCSDDVPLLETGSLTVDAEDGFQDGWYRIYMTASQDTREKVPVATLLLEQSSLHHDKMATEVTANGFSVLKPAADRLLARGSFAAKGSNGAGYVKRLLEECTPAPVVAEGEFTVVENMVFDIGASYLEACWTVLRAGGWCMQVDGRGVVHVIPLPTQPALSLDRAHTKLLQPGVGEEVDISSIPNRYYAVEEGAFAVAENVDQTPRTSFEARGRWVDYMDHSPVRTNGESLERYARRRLDELCSTTKRYTYTREFWPDVLPFSLIDAALPGAGVEGTMRVVSQSVECGNGITIQETATQEMRL